MRPYILIRSLVGLDRGFAGSVAHVRGDRVVI
jgi:protease II